MWLLGGVFLGWSLGQNDAANVIGSAVATRMLRFRTAILLAAVFVVLGAVLEGRPGIETYSRLTHLTLGDAVVVTVGAALSVTLLSLFGLPSSSSQATVGSILAVGLLKGQCNLAGFTKVAMCWVGTPLGGAIIAMGLYLVLGVVYNRLRWNLFQSDAALRLGLLLAGAYGAYALGANNVANVMGVFAGAGVIDVPTAALAGGASMALGILTCNRRVIETVGRGLVRLNPYGAFVVLLAQAITVHIYTQLGVPVSTSQAVIGAILGVGAVRGINTVRPRMLLHIVVGWVLTPVLGGVMALLVHVARHLRYVP
ncbi:MAG: inorganic phosphate transporter family protein [Lentisphaerae bacterium]|nr:inorganic phosphate transporter family protein [Lentisphaerota bacterium]